MNVSPITPTLFKGTIVAKISPVEEISEPVEDKENELAKTVPDHLQDLYDKTVKDLFAYQAKQARIFLRKFSSLFSKYDGDFGRTSIIKHSINVENPMPVREPPRKVPHLLQSEYDQAVDSTLEKNIIEPSTSLWASGVVLVKKKDGTTRFCIDYRRLNQVTIKYAYPLPRIDDSLNQLSGTEWFSTIDLSSGYWQVELEQKDRLKTSFVTRKGLFQFQVMPFVLCNAPATFEQLMESVLVGPQWSICLIYLDDVIIYSTTFDEMVLNLTNVFV